MKARPTLATVGLALGLIATGSSALAEDVCWPQWRGPYRDGQAEGFEVLEHWPEALELVWQVEVEPGHSGPVVDCDRVYLHTRSDTGEAVEARSLVDGSAIWRQHYSTSYSVHPEADWHGRGPFSTPLIENGVLYTFGISEVLSAWAAEDGELLWQIDFGEEFDTPWAHYGTSLSPIMVSGKLIVHVGGPDDGALVALEASTGKELWRIGLEGPPYGSAVVVEIDGVQQLVSFTQNRLIGVDVVEGRLLWAIPYSVQWDNTMQTPVVVDGVIIVAAWQTPVRGYRVERDGDAWKIAIAWENPRGASAFSSPVVIESQLWGLSQRDSGRLYRLNPATGQITWQGPPRLGDHASLVAAGGYMMFFSDSGQLTVWDATADVPEALAQFQISEDAMWAHPAVFSGQLLTRGLTDISLWRIPVAEGIP
jgi:outer membrane protein assembly factor BamB